MRLVIAMSIIFLLFCSGFFYLYYRANEAEQAQAQETMCRISMVNFTDSLASAIEKRFLLAQAQLLLFADNLLELSGQHTKGHVVQHILQIRGIATFVMRPSIKNKRMSQLKGYAHP